MNTLLDSTIEDLLSGNLKIIKKVRETKAYYVGERRVKARKAVFYYAKNKKDGSKNMISAKIRKQYEDLLSKH